MDVEPAVAAFEVAGAVAGHAMPQRQVLRARRRPDGIGLHEAEAIERGLQVAGANKLRATAAPRGRRESPSRLRSSRLSG